MRSDQDFGLKTVAALIFRLEEWAELCGRGDRFNRI